MIAVGVMVILELSQRFSFPFPGPGSTSTPILNNSNDKKQPSLPPKPSTASATSSSDSASSESEGSPQPPPYVPAPPPNSNVNSTSNSMVATAAEITVSRTQNYQPSSNLSVSTHPAEEGTSVDDDMPSASDDNEDASGKDGGQAGGHGQGQNLMVRPPPPNVHISINRRIEMPPAFHFPEDQTPPSDLLGGAIGAAGASSTETSQDVIDNAIMYSQMYQDFERMTSDEGRFKEEDDIVEETHKVPDVIESEEPKRPKPPGIIKKQSITGTDKCKSSHSELVL